MQHFFKNPRPAVTLSAPAPIALIPSVSSPLSALRALRGESLDPSVFSVPSVVNPRALRRESLLPVQRRQDIDEVVDLLFEGEVGDRDS